MGKNNKEKEVESVEQTEEITYNKSASQEELKAGDFVKVVPLNYDVEIVGSLIGVNPHQEEGNAFVQWVENREVKSALITMSHCELIIRS